jgi:serine/threonine protein kinase
MIESSVEGCGYHPRTVAGTGTYGIVYIVEDKKHQLYAFKHMEYPDYKVVGFDNLLEIDILSRIHHPNIIHSVKILSSVDCDISGLSIVMPLAERTLYDIIYKGNFTTKDKISILYKIISGIHFLHTNNILHLDIKATNIVMQGSTPYIIDFGLSMKTNDASILTPANDLKVSIDYRPPEVLLGNRMYGAATDIWSLGILALNLFSEKNPVLSIIRLVEKKNRLVENKDKEVGEEVLKLFLDKGTIPTLFKNINTTYRESAIDLVASMLQINPNDRTTTIELLYHPLFDHFKEYIEGTNDIPPISFDYSENHRDIIKLIVHWALEKYSNFNAELLFLAIDIFNRVSSYYKEDIVETRMNVGVCSLYMAIKLLDHGRFMLLSEYVSYVNALVPEATIDSILEIEKEIIYHLDGVLLVNNLYNECDNGNELQLCAHHVILNNDVTTYARVDIPRWKKVMKSMIKDDDILPKNISISTIFQ